MNANDRQVGGDHYKNDGEQHWDRQYRLFGRGYFIGCITKYVERAHLKNGKQDLEKAIHFIEKLIELEYPDQVIADPRFPFNPEYAPLASFPQVKPTGWVGFVFEGATADQCLYTCRMCNEHIWVPINSDPITNHSCEGVVGIRTEVEQANDL